MSRQTQNMDVTKSKTTIWDYVPRAVQKYREREKTIAGPAGKLISSTTRPAVERGEEDVPAIRSSQQAVQPVAWETRAVRPDGATTTDRPDSIPMSRLPVASVWR